MNHVKYLDNESYDGGVARSFIALEFMMLENLPNLVKLLRVDEENIFPSLSKLQISECPKLTLPCLSSLQELVIQGECNQDLPGSICEFLSPESLSFHGNRELTCLSDGMLRNLPSLKILDIRSHLKLEAITIDIINLKELYIFYCGSLQPLTEQFLKGLHSLERLEIVRNWKFNFSAGVQHLTYLEHLKIAGFPEVEGFPEALRHMTDLQSLTLFDLHNLGSLPGLLGNLGLLNSLSINDCRKLMCLLPTNIRSLSCLENLQIHHCPVLERRCEEDIGEDCQ